MNIRTLAIAGFGALALMACDNDDDGFENVGEQMDEAVDDMGDSANDAGENLEDAADDAGDAIEDAGDDLEREVN